MTVVTSSPARSVDLAGIGFGPANLALAVALAEGAGTGLRAWHFLEAQRAFSWHAGMLLPQARMQISFLKDLVTACDPASRFTFLKYLHEKGRLRGFINQQNFHPSRQEFQDYLRWAADGVSSHVSYGQRVHAVEPVRDTDGRIVRLRLHGEDQRGTLAIAEASSLVIATGGAPAWPATFVKLKGHASITHSAGYLPAMQAVAAPPQRIAVVGAGQSAAEIFLDLHHRFPDAALDLIYRGLALRVADASPFVNEIFEPEMIGLLHGQTPERQRHFLADFRHTNYAAIDADLLRHLSDLLYQQKLSGLAPRLRLCPRRRILDVAAVGRKIHIASRDEWTGEAEEAHYDIVVLATGYDRSGWRKLVEPLSPWLDAGQVGRDWRLAADPALAAPVYVQGGAEQSHGIGDTLLSHLPERARTILASVSKVLGPKTGAFAQQRVERAMQD